MLVYNKKLWICFEEMISMDREKLDMAIEFITQMNPDERKTLAQILGQNPSFIPNNINTGASKNVRENSTTNHRKQRKDRTEPIGTTGQRPIVDPTNIQIRLGK